MADKTEDAEALFGDADADASSSSSDSSSSSSSSEEDSQDDFQVTLKQDTIATVASRNAPEKGGGGRTNDPRFGGMRLGTNALPGGATSVLELDAAELEDKPWRRPGADMSDYFNYGFTEETWKAYAQQQLQLRREHGGAVQSNIAVYDGRPGAPPMGGGRPMPPPPPPPGAPPMGMGAPPMPPQQHWQGNAPHAPPHGYAGHPGGPYDGPPAQKRRR